MKHTPRNKPSKNDPVYVLDAIRLTYKLSSEEIPKRKMADALIIPTTADIKQPREKMKSEIANEAIQQPSPPNTLNIIHVNNLTMNILNSKSELIEQK
jgi:hypothetical protein